MVEKESEAVAVDRVSVDPRSIRSRLGALLLRVLAFPIIALWSWRPGWRWPYDSFESIAGALNKPVARSRRDVVELPHCSAELQTPATANADRAILYLHGGAFMVGGPGSHRRLAGSIAVAAGAQVLSVDYRMLPAGHPVSTSVDDCLDGYRWLLDRGFRGENIVIIGDSAGGYLTPMVALRAAAAGLPTPGALICECPLIEPTAQSRLTGRFGPADPIFPRNAFHAFERVMREAEPSGKVVGPLDYDLSGLPPTLIQCGSGEWLRTDAEDFADALGRAGVPCRLEVYRGQVHVFQAFISLLPEARTAIKSMAEFALAAYRRAESDDADGSTRADGAA